MLRSRAIGESAPGEHRALVILLQGFIGLVLALGSLQPAAASEARHRHGIAMHGEPALSVGFPHFPYVRPDAPKGGRIVFGVQGTFDSLNPYIVRGAAVQSITGNVVESLMARSYNEPFTLYGLVAETVATPEDRSFVEFRVNPRARFSDGVPVTAEDVLFSWQLLKEHGRPNHRTYYRKARSATVLDRYTIRFDLTGAADRELPLILGLMPVLPKHAIDPETFERTGLKPLIGSGPYVVGEVRPGDSVTLKRNPDYWGAQLPAMQGFANADELRYDYYRDANTMFEAFKKGLYDIRPEGDPTRWNTGYDIPALREGRIVKERFTSGVPKGMNGFVFNTRRPLFSDVRVREALGYLFDFEWINANLFYGAYARTGSYFEGSELSARGRPAGPAERTLLAPFPNAVRPDVMAGEWNPPVSSASGRDRAAVRHALQLLRAAGWQVVNGALRRNGEPFAFEILVRSKEQERVSLAYARSLERVGIKATVRLVDAVQFDRRLGGYDFDMTQFFWFASLSPGNEQAFYWGSKAADTEGTRNYMGAREPAIDAMISAIVDAHSRRDLVAAVRALDRVLISGFYVVPLYHLPEQWIARSGAIGRPDVTSLYGPIVETWWRNTP